MASTSPPERLIIGLDLGTVNSSVAYTLIKQRKWTSAHQLGSSNSSIVRNWSSGAETNYVDTVLQYEKGKPGKKPNFGYGVVNAQKTRRLADPTPEIRFFKLALHRSQETEEVRKMLAPIAKSIKKNPVDFVQDFVEAIRGHLVDGPHAVFRRIYGERFSEMELEWVLTLPAGVRSPREQQEFIDAAIRAGITAPTLISEPEATATIFFAENETSMEVGETFIICDIGGGTVDTVTYTVIGLEPLRLSERCVADGELCGSIFLDKRYRKLLENKLRKEKDLPSNLEDLLDDQLKVFKNNIKPGFENAVEDSVVYFTDLPNVREGAANCTMGELRQEVFDPVCAQISELIRRQLDSSQAAADCENIRHGEERGQLKVKAIIMAGQTSQNVYIHNYLETRFNSEASPYGKIEVRRPPSSVDTAVAQGCVLMAIDRAGLVPDRKSKFSYGVLSWVDPEYFGGRKKKRRIVFDPNEGLQWIKAVEWLIRKDEPIANETLYTERKRYHNVAQGGNFIFKEQIVLSNLNTWGKTMTPTYSNKEYEASVEQLATITLDLSQVPRESFQKDQHSETNDFYWKVAYKVGLSLEHDVMSFYALTQTPDGVVRRTEFSFSFDSVASTFKSFGTVADRWRDNPQAPQAKPRKRQLIHEEKRELRMSPRIHDRYLEGGQSKKRARLQEPMFDGAYDEEEDVMGKLQESSAKRTTKKRVRGQTSIWDVPSSDDERSGRKTRRSDSIVEI